MDGNLRSKHPSVTGSSHGPCLSQRGAQCSCPTCEGICMQKPDSDSDSGGVCTSGGNPFSSDNNCGVFSQSEGFLTPGCVSTGVLAPKTDTASIPGSSAGESPSCYDHSRTPTGWIDIASCVSSGIIPAAYLISLVHIFSKSSYILQSSSRGIKILPCIWVRFGRTASHKTWNLPK